MTEGIAARLMQKQSPSAPSSRACLQGPALAWSLIVSDMEMNKEFGFHWRKKPRGLSADGTRAQNALYVLYSLVLWAATLHSTISFDCW
jgi:hypothetical protein